VVAVPADADARALAPAEPAREAGVPMHVACIMDGNGRWAKRRGLPRTAGHTEGEEALARLVRVAVTRNVGWLTVFGFSTENWTRRTERQRCAGSMDRSTFR